MDRRSFVKMGVMGGAVGVVSAGAGELQPTPSDIEGPFYPVMAQKDKDFDLTRIEGEDGVAEGRVIHLVGRVLDTKGRVVEDATVDIWQANAAGRYRHPHDRNEAPLDPFFQGWAIVLSGVDGGFRFKTIYPGAYPASDGWTRPPHIHFKVSKRGYVELVTQMYFPGEALNEKDRLLGGKTAEERALMIAELIEEEPARYRYDIVLAEA